MGRRELKLQKRIVAYIERKGGAARICAQTEYTTVGDPDIYGCIKGRMIQLEVKDGDEYDVQPIQEERLAEWFHAGAVTFVVRSLREAEIVIDFVSDHPYRPVRPRDFRDAADARDARLRKASPRRKRG